MARTCPSKKSRDFYPTFAATPPPPSFSILRPTFFLRSSNTKTQTHPTIWNLNNYLRRILNLALLTQNTLTDYLHHYQPSRWILSAPSSSPVDALASLVSYILQLSHIHDLSRSRRRIAILYLFRRLEMTPSNPSGRRSLLICRVKHNRVVWNSQAVSIYAIQVEYSNCVAGLGRRRYRCSLKNILQASRR